MRDIKSIKKEYEEVLNQLSDPELVSNWDKFDELNKRKGVLEKVIEKEKEIEGLNNRIQESKSMLGSKEDPELSSLAEAEISQLLEKQAASQKELETMLNQKEGPEGPKAVIVEIRAGAGGDEAAIFVADLFRIYSKYAALKGWQQRILDSRPSDINGFKEIVFELKNSDAFSKMKYESGVHRVQRIPITEKAGRIHTSTVSVAILARPSKSEIKIRPDEMKIDYYRSSGPGGQNVNKRETAVRITHLPSGIVVTSQTERNQLQNKENALSILEAKLLEKKEIEEMEKTGSNRNAQIGSAKRAEKIRTYNFPQDRITDHRIKKSFHNIEEVMEGKMDPIIDALQEDIVD
ncbi:MAG: peptide chain release factor 1 [Parcubacteria group bacterium]|nr:MAG: peptide chain release factor 1 [Parcubacteria group bacterium]